MKLPKLVCIVGPTASGKTELALKLAKKFNGEIISADSRQIYRGMDIGTAKPSLSFSPLVRGRLRGGGAPSNDGAQVPVISSGIPHYLIDIKNPNQLYTLAQYKTDALKAIKKILKSGKLPFLVGGTGLYIRAVLDNYEIPKVKPNKKLRTKLEKEIQKHGLASIFQKLIRLDPEAAYIVGPKNPRRIIRALEVALATKKPLSQNRKKRKPLFDALVLGIYLPPEKLKERIFKRADFLIKQGLVKEVQKLIKRYGSKPVAFDAIGYREIIDYLDKKISLAQAIEEIKKNTWRFARRQMTWFKKMPVVWVKNQREAERKIKKFLSTQKMSKKMWIYTKN